MRAAAADRGAGHGGRHRGHRARCPRVRRRGEGGSGTVRRHLGALGDYPAALSSLPSGARTAAPHLTWSGAPTRDGKRHLPRAGRLPRPLPRPAGSHCVPGSPAARRSSAWPPWWARGLRPRSRPRRRGGRRRRSRRPGAGPLRWRDIGRNRGSATPSASAIRPTGVSGPISLRPGDSTVLTPNMCFHMILGMWLDQWGYEMSETFRVTEAGPPEVLARFPRRLFVKA